MNVPTRAVSQSVTHAHTHTQREKSTNVYFEVAYVNTVKAESTRGREFSASIFFFFQNGCFFAVEHFPLPPLLRPERTTTRRSSGGGGAKRWDVLSKGRTKTFFSNNNIKEATRNFTWYKYPLKISVGFFFFFLSIWFVCACVRVCICAHVFNLKTSLPSSRCFLYGLTRTIFHVTSSAATRYYYCCY